MKSKCLLFLMLCLFFNACSNEDVLITPDSKRAKREMSEEDHRCWRKAAFDIGVHYHTDYLVKSCKDAQEWIKLIHFSPGYRVGHKIKRLNLPLPSGWKIQDIEFAWGTVVNMDYFPVTIEKMPTVNGKELSPLEFFEHVRKNLNDFISFMGTRFHTMEEKLPNDPRFKGETQLWQSSHPFSALLSITIPLNSGSVICSDYYNYYDINYNFYTSEYAKSNWKFTTITTPPNVDSKHPVSGNREFGCVKNDNGSYTFYTRGVDRVQSNEIFKDPLGSLSYISFFGSDVLWSSFQSGLEDFVNSHSGRAQARTSKKIRPDWDKVKAASKGDDYEGFLCKEY